MNKEINTYMITIAREARRKNQTQLAKELGIKQARLSKIEAGIAPIDDELLNKISSNLNFPKEFFFEQYTPVDTEYKLHRKQAALKQTELSYISSNSNIIDMEIGKLLNSLEIDTSIPEKLNLDYLDSPEDVAIGLREYLSLPKGGIYNITNLIESLGIIIVNFDYPDIKFDGVSFYNKKNIPIMIINKNLPPDRDRFTKAHELGHILMHKFPSPDAEKEANRFASEFLMPKKDILADLNNLSFYSLPNLKRKWKVSMASLIYRAKELSTINESREKSLWAQMSRAHYRQHEPEMGILKENTELLDSILDYHRKILGYTESDIVKYFSIFLDDYNHLFNKYKQTNIRINSGLKRVK